MPDSNSIEDYRSRKREQARARRNELAKDPDKLQEFLRKGRDSQRKFRANNPEKIREKSKADWKKRKFKALENEQATTSTASSGPVAPSPGSALPAASTGPVTPSPGSAVPPASTGPVTPSPGSAVPPASSGPVTPSPGSAVPAGGEHPESLPPPPPNPAEPAGMDRGLSPLSEPPETPPATRRASPPHSPPPRPYCIPPPASAPDLLSDVVGTQVHQGAEIVTWPNGWKTVLPIAVEDGVNILQPDAERVRWLTDPKNAISEMDQSSTVRYLDKSAYPDKKTLIEDIRSLNAHNYTVVVPGGVSAVGKKFENYDDLNSEFGLGVSNHLQLQYHDLKKRICDSSRYHVYTTVEDFITNIRNPDTVGMILDIPTSQQAIPVPFHLLAESTAALHQMKSDQSMKASGLNVPLHMDTLFAPTWALLHHAGTFTNVHQDAGGYSVAGQVLGDPNDPQPKVWAIMSFKDPMTAPYRCEELAEKIAEICDYVNEKRGSTWHWDSSIWDDCRVELIYLCPGDMFFQPPGALHVVYTPRACVASGGHYYNYDSLHLTEWTRRIQHLQSKRVTNQDPARVKEALNAMMLNFPNLHGRVFHKRAIAALCKMVLAENEYVYQGQHRVRVGTKLDERAESVAAIVTCLCLDGPTLYTKGYKNAIIVHLGKLLSETDDYRNPGEPFVLIESVYDAVEQAASDLWSRRKQQTVEGKPPITPKGKVKKSKGKKKAV